MNSQRKEHAAHENHDHSHGQNCGHKKIRHEDHTDYLHGGHLHFVTGDRVVEHSIPVSATNPAECPPQHHICKEHPPNHQHNSSCGHETVPHGDHVDYLVGKHLHHHHNDHCDDHGQLEIA